MTDELAGGVVTRIEALGYRSLRYVSRGLGRFHVLVGPNGSGKSTFLDVVAFLGDLVQYGLQVAIQGDPKFDVPMRAPDGRHLAWMRRGDRFELAIEMTIPEKLRARLENARVDRCRYEVAVDVGGPFRIAGETLWLKPGDDGEPRQRTLFPDPPEPVASLVLPPGRRSPAGWKKVVSRGEEPEKVLFRSETSGWNNPFRIEADRSALASLPEDQERFPVATWFRRRLTEGVQRLALSAEAMRRPSPPGRSVGYLPDGSNLPHVIHRLERKDRERLRRWVAHLREALPDLEAVETREREEDRHRYLVLRYRNGLVAPSWLVSDGTLRMLALTMLAYLPDVSGIYLVEEPENGIHPAAVEVVFQSLSSVYGAQVLLATHSPVVLRLAQPSQVLCVGRTKDGATDLVAGNEHPRLREWKGTMDMGSLLAAGILS